MNGAVFQVLSVILSEAEGSRRGGVGVSPRDSSTSLGMTTEAND